MERTEGLDLEGKAYSASGFVVAGAGWFLLRPASCSCAGQRRRLLDLVLGPVCSVPRLHPIWCRLCAYLGLVSHLAAMEA